MMNLDVTDDMLRELEDYCEDAGVEESQSASENSLTVDRVFTGQFGGASGK